MVLTFDNDYAPNNVYGHALTLLRRICVSDSGVHLDVGCGFGRIAEPLVASLGCHYVGVDMDQDGLSSLVERGFETHRFRLTEREMTLDFLREALGNRPLGSLTILDTLEHVEDPLGALQALHDLAAEHAAPLIVSVPNVTHRDVAIKLLSGRFDYTKAGLLDHTHINFFSEARLLAMARRAGWHQLDGSDVRMQDSDQHFPSSHLALAKGSALQAFLNQVRDQADEFGSVNQFVRAFAVGPIHPEPGYVEASTAPEPFLSVVTRTQGLRPDGLRDMFVTLMGQTSTDFEVVVIGHKLNLARQLLVERIIADNPQWLRERTRLVLVDHGNRTTPLNAGFAAARGTYVSILDDDDMVFGHWVETFLKLADKAPGALLRARCVRQHNLISTTDGQEIARPTSGFERISSDEFDFAAHLHMNHTPGLAAAFPRSLFADFGLRFDETLTTTEDWDFLLRAIGLCGVANSSEITSIYRWWTNRETSLQQHVQAEWDANREVVMAKLDAQPFLLPPGGTRRIRALYQIEVQVHALHQEVAHLRAQLDLAMARNTPAHRAEHLRQQLHAIYASSSWRLSRPMRWLGRLVGRPPPVQPMPETLNREQLEKQIEVIRCSTSWRLTGPIRVIVRALRRR